jgi:hypothetical protein
MGRNAAMAEAQRRAPQQASMASSAADSLMSFHDERV